MNGSFVSSWMLYDLYWSKKQVLLADFWMILRFQVLWCLEFSIQETPWNICSIGRCGRYGSVAPWKRHNHQQMTAANIWCHLWLVRSIYPAIPAYSPMVLMNSQGFQCRNWVQYRSENSQGALDRSSLQWSNCWQFDQRKSDLRSANLKGYTLSSRTLSFLVYPLMC